MRILAVGAGVIGSVYAGRLLQVGHELTFLARNGRLSELRAVGLILDEPLVETHTIFDVRATDALEIADTFDLVVVAVRAKQVLGTLPVLCEMTDNSDVLFLGDLDGHQGVLAETLGPRALFGFPSVTGVQVGSTTRFAQIGRQRTMLSEPDGAMTARIRRLQTEFSIAGFPTGISANIHDWMLGHEAFTVPIACALGRVGIDPGRLSADPDTLRLMVTATREALVGLREHGNTEIPASLRMMYRWLPTAVVLAYWRHLMHDRRGELWFGAHTRDAADELRSRASELEDALAGDPRGTPALDRLISGCRF